MRQNFIFRFIFLYTVMFHGLCANIGIMGYAHLSRERCSPLLLLVMRSWSK